MQDIESHTIIYLRSAARHAGHRRPRGRHVPGLLGLRGDASTASRLARFLEAAGARAVVRAPRRAARSRSRKRLEARGHRRGVEGLARLLRGAHDVGRDQRADHAHRLSRLAGVAGHPVLTELLDRIVRDESRHFFFYYRQAELRLRRPAAARIARFLVDRFWAPVGSGVQPRRGAALPGHLPLRRAARAGPPPARSTRRSGAYPASRPCSFSRRGWTAVWRRARLPAIRRRTQWRPRSLSDPPTPAGRADTTAPTPRGRSRAPSATR